ncbi:MAG TPA: cyclopropane fatty acyl phospholipid synthase [Balneolaceae bacterium]|nr:cyclopropane fatty acyl phospholipid synthase [Balneolaceae bacterium]
MQDLKRKFQDILAVADVRINGNRPWDIQVHNDRLYPRVLQQGSLGFGEAYMDGWWDAEQLDEFFYHILRENLQQEVSLSWPMLRTFVKSWLQNPQSGKKSFEVGKRHYDTGNDLFERMLDKRMVYTCGYWLGVDTLDEAQEKKLDMVCQKLQLSAGQRVLDIGCGWGSFAKFAAENYDVEIVGLTVSREQQELARDRCKGLPVEIRLQDYREMDEKFDRIVSLGMFEHVGVKNYRTYMRVAARCLGDDGIFVLHTIGGNISVRNTDPWIEKYIFPNSMIPSIRQIGLAIEDLFVMEQWDNYGPHYDRTLMAWYKNVNDHWDELKHKYSERFYRMWEYYLMASAGSFRARKNQQWQIVLSKKGLVDKPPVVSSSEN